MMMKTMKLMMATALATATLVGTSMESAEAVSRGTGTDASGSRKNVIEVDYEFQLFPITLEGDDRKDEDKDLNNNTGIFTGAIENFKGRINDVSGDRLEFEFAEEILGSVNSPLTLNLTAKLISAGSDILLPDGTAAINAYSKEKLTATENRIEYTLTGNALEDSKISELTLIIAGLNDINKYRKDVNFIKEIINDNMLDKVNKFRISGKLASEIESQNQTIFSVEDTLDVARANLINDRVVEVPESSTANSLLALGFLAVGSLLRRKMKESNRIQL
jgi:hypothetical protein